MKLGATSSTSIATENFGAKDYVDTAGKNARKITEYIQNRLKEDALSDQQTLDVRSVHGWSVTKCACQTKQNAV